MATTGMGGGLREEWKSHTLLARGASLRLLGYVCSVVPGQGRSGDGSKSDLHTGLALVA